MSSHDLESLPTIGDRTFTANAPSSTFDALQPGVLRTKYRGIPFYKSPLDIGLYINLLQKFEPKTVIEIGTKFGGSALWFADLLTNYQIENARVVSIDIEPIAEVEDDRILFMKGDAKHLDKVLTQELLGELEHPFLVIEDSSHYYPETYAVLEFFGKNADPCDYVVVEDGIVSLLSNPAYRQFDGGPNRAVADFLTNNPGVYEIDTAQCDYYGYNMTYSLNGWLQRV